MNKQALEAIQNREYQILKEIKRICEKNNIPYVLIGGSCLGAVRHQNFIPWDDDIDIGMTRNDFESFKRACQTDLKSQYYFQDLFSEENCSLVFGKIRDKNSLVIEGYSEKVNIQKGIWVDIFPYDKIPKDMKKARKINIRISFLKSLLNIKCGYRYSVKGKEIALFWIGYAVSLFMPKMYLKNRIYQLMTRYNEKAGEYSYMTYGGFGIVEMLDEDICLNTTKHRFRDDDFPIPKDYKAYLTQLYGDYMQLPPESERENGHGIKKLVIDNKEIRL